MYITLRVVQFEDPEDFLSEIVFQNFVSLKVNQSLAIGRSEKCDIFIDDIYCSAYHSLLEFKDGSLFLSDSLSKNGTKLNDKKILSPKKMYINDVVSIGKTYIHIDVEKTLPETKKLLLRSNDEESDVPEEFGEITRINMPDIPEN